MHIVSIITVIGIVAAFSFGPKLIADSVWEREHHVPGSPFVLLMRDGHEVVCQEYGKGPHVTVISGEGDFSHYVHYIKLGTRKDLKYLGTDAADQLFQILSRPYQSLTIHGVGSLGSAAVLLAFHTSKGPLKHALAKASWNFTGFKASLYDEYSEPARSIIRLISLDSLNLHLDEAVESLECSSAKVSFA